MAIFKGAGVAIVTPMYEDGKVNYDKLEELLEFQIANSTDAIIICGTTGESSTMTHGEHLKTIKFAIDKVNKRVPVIAGTGSNCTETAIMMSKEAASYGADALLVVTPYYNKATQKGLIAHYTAIANAVPETPIIMYNVPSRTGCNIQPATVATLVKNVKNIVGLKAEIFLRSQRQYLWQVLIWNCIPEMMIRFCRSFHLADLALSLYFLMLHRRKHMIWS